MTARRHAAALVLFVAGIAFLPRGRMSVLLLGFLAFYVLLHVASHGYPRYRVPSMPVVFLVAAHGWVAARARPRLALEWRHRLAAAATALVLALSVGPSLVTWVTRPWPPPWFAGVGVEGAGEGEGASPGETPEEGH